MIDAKRFGEIWDGTMRWLREYHRHEIVGGEHVPQVGPAIVACSHSLATYENFLLTSASVDLIGRRPLILADDQMFRVPWIARGLKEIGMVPGRREAALAQLAKGELVGLAPGGMRDAVRSSRRRYEFNWDGRMGFVWVSMLSGAPILLAACPNADEIFTVYESRITPWAYQRFHLPMLLFRGRGPTPLPRPIKLVHVIDEPIAPPPIPPDRVTKEDVKRHHQLIVERMRALMPRAIEISNDLRDSNAKT